MDTLSITSSQIEGKSSVTVFHLSGTMDATSENDLCRHARQAFDSGVQNLVLNMKNVEMITSAGLRALHNIFKMCTTKKEIEDARLKDEFFKSPHFKLAAASPQVYYVLNLAGFLHNIPFYTTLEEALDSYTA